MTGLWPAISAAWNGKPYSPAGVFIAVDGTVYPGAPAPPTPLLNDGTGFWSGFASGIAGGLINTQDGLWDCVEIGYPASTTPMWPSAMIARANVTTVLNGGTDSNGVVWPGYPLGTKVLVSGYSQGAMAVDWWWINDVIVPGSPLYDRFQNGDFLRIYNFGDVLRCPGIANGNTLLWGQPVPPDHDGQMTGGIGGPLDLTPAQTNIPSPYDGLPIIMSFDNPGDLYGAAPCGADPWTTLPSVESVEYIFFKIIMYEDPADYLRLAELILKPIGDIEAAINAGVFFAEGTASPHYAYYPAMLAAIDDALAIGNALPHQSGS